MENGYAMLSGTSYHSQGTAAYPRELAASAAELGYSAAALADQGTFDGLPAFIKECRQKGIKPIAGMEISLSCGFWGYGQMSILVANESGLAALESAARESCESVEENLPGFMDMDILQKWLGCGKPAYKDIYLLSGGRDGPLSKILLHNRTLDEEIARLCEKQSQYKLPDPGEILEVKNRLKRLVLKEDALAEKCRLYKKDKDKSVYDQAKIELRAVKKERKKQEKNWLTYTERSEKYEEYSKAIKRLQEKHRDDLFMQALQQARYFKEQFGNFYIEIRYHGAEEEAYCIPKLVDIAKYLDIPLLANNTIRYIRAADITKWQLLIASVHGHWVRPEKHQKNWYMKDPGQIVLGLRNFLDERDINQAMENTRVIADACMGGAELEQALAKNKKTIDTIDTGDPVLVSECTLSALDLLRVSEECAGRYNIPWDAIPIEQDIFESCRKKDDIFHCNPLPDEKNKLFYATLSYKAEYLQVMQPSGFFAAYLAAYPNTANDVANACEKAGVQIWKAEINQSDVHTAAISDKVILIGLGHIKGVGIPMAEQIVVDRKKNGRFGSRADFIRRMGTGTLKTLDLAGVFRNMPDRTITEDRDPYNERNLYGAVLSRKILKDVEDTPYDKASGWKETFTGVVMDVTEAMGLAEATCGCMISGIEGDRKVDIPEEIYAGIKGKVKKGICMRVLGTRDTLGGAIRAYGIQFIKTPLYFIPVTRMDIASRYQEENGIDFYVMAADKRLYPADIRISREGLY
ncbi:MAG TPA: PHP domain-containing protein, partial [Candidatus Blautia faecavium]|nr:PHP domain-containing protein [Candidatus Blautia faecavium]